MNENLRFSKIETVDESLAERYGQYARPMAHDLMKSMKLDIEYTDGQGQWLKATIDGIEKEILDMTGGYGANLLGHKNKVILDKAISHMKFGAPMHVQASVRTEAGRLGQKISEYLQEEIMEGPWITHLSNSGSEAVEAALKHTLLRFKNLQQERIFEQNRELNEYKIFIQNISEIESRKFYLKLKKDLSIFIIRLNTIQDKKDWLLHLTINAHSLLELVEVIHQYNTSLLESSPIMVALEKSYHGKLMGSLKLTSSDKYKEPFYLENNLDVSFLAPTLNNELIDSFFKKHEQDLIQLNLIDGEIHLRTLSYSRIGGLILEPIQGEAGIYTLPPQFIQYLKKCSIENNFLLIFDEIQSGLYRTGKLCAGSHAQVSADIYCFSKTLGGGVAKIGATVIHHKKYIKEFGLLHTSTFSEDAFSSLVAIDVLDFFKNNLSLVEESMFEGINLKHDLEELQEKFPHVLKDVRGMGLMLAIEWNEQIIDQCFEFKMLAESQSLGYLFSSFLLHQHSIRTTPSLSNGMVLRIQPCLYFSTYERKLLVNAIERLCYYISERKLKDIIQHLYPGENLTEHSGIDFEVPKLNKERPLAVFLCHFIDGDHIKKLSPILYNISNDKIEEQFKTFKNSAQFSILHHQTLRDSSNTEIDIILMGIPVTSQELKKEYQSKNRVQLIKKIQDTVDRCQEMGATTIGLGQFTSIVTNNGLYLDSRGMNLTTGNSFTLSLALKAAFKAAILKNINVLESTVAVIGAAGNIMSIASSMMAENCQKLILIHHTEVSESKKFLNSIKSLLRFIHQSEMATSFMVNIKNLLPLSLMTDDKLLITKLKNEEIREFFEVTSDLEKIKEAHLILTGASTAKGILKGNYLRENAIVVDVAVPANITPEEFKKLQKDRPDIHYLLGGIAQLPKSQSIATQIFTLNEGESYACMAETFLLTFSKNKNYLHIGNLTRGMVDEVNILAYKSGFDLAGFKLKTSIL